MTLPASTRLVLPLGLGMIIAFASSYYLLGVMAGPMAAATGTTSGRLYSALSGAFLTAALCSLVSGRWTDRRGGREVLIMASILLAGALALMAMAQTEAMAIMGVLSLGFGMGIGFYAPANALLVVLYGHEAKKPMTAVSLIGACGGAIGWPLTLFLIEGVGWRGACWFWAGSHLLICLPLYLRLLPKVAGGLSRGRGDGVKWDRPMIQLAILFAGGWCVATGFASQMPRVLIALGLTPAQAATAAATMAISVIAMRVLVLILPRAGSPVIMVRFATLLLPLGVCIAVLGGSGAAVAVPIGQGAGNGLLSVAASLVPLHVFGTANFGQRQVLMMLPARFVQSLAPMCFGLAMDQSVGLALGISTGLCLMMFAMSFGLGPRRSEAPVAIARFRA